MHVDLVPERRALLIGCNYPGQDEQLDACIGDILKVASHLQQSGYKCTVLRDDQPEQTLETMQAGAICGCVRGGIRSHPTRANIVAALKSIIKWANEEPGSAIALNTPSPLPVTFAHLWQAADLGALLRPWRERAGPLW